MQRSTYDIFHEACLLMQASSYPKAEQEALVAQLLEAHFGLKRLDVVVRRMVEISPTEWEEWQKLVDRLSKNEPIQHLIQSVDFLDFRLSVSGDVLIPRPETEEWAQAFIEQARLASFADIVDICTGSGCIAIALARAFPQARVQGWDISLPALRLAQQNAEAAGAKVEFKEVDILQEGLPALSIEWILVSNPPYIPQRELAEMRPNVTDYEPHLALFVPDNAPLLFYERLAYLARVGKPCLFAVEIHEDFAEQVRALFVCAGYADCHIGYDFRGKARWVWGK